MYPCKYTIAYSITKNPPEYAILGDGVKTLPLEKPSKLVWLKH